MLNKLAFVHFSPERETGFIGKFNFLSLFILKQSALYQLIILSNNT